MSAGKDQETILQEMMAHLQDLQREWPKLHEPPPERLYHYTTLEGLMGIVETHSIWASDCRYMNDSSELTYAVNFIQNTIEECFKKLSSEALQKALPSRTGFAANAFAYFVRPYVACFCEDEDLLSQWRGYGVGQSAFSLGLNLRGIAGGQPVNTHLRKVIYDETRQRELVYSVVETWLRGLEAALEAGGALDPRHPAIWSLQRALAEHHLCFKDPAFAEEKEWRLIKLVNVDAELSLLEHRRRVESLKELEQRYGTSMPPMPEPPTWSQPEGLELKFRCSSLGLIPYVELPLIERGGAFTGRLPLWQVIQGPTRHPELSLESLRTYLRSKEYGFPLTDIRPSRVPLRPQ